MHRSVWLLAVVVAVTGVFLATPALAGKGSNSAGKGGNSAHAKACQRGGWMKLVRSDQRSFKNQGACVSYGAHGGTLLAAADRAYCAPSGPPTFGQCFYTANASLMLAELDFDFAASSGPGGQTPSGNFRFDWLPFHFAGRVTCLEMEVLDGAQIAVIGGVITDSNARPVGSGFVFTATDNAPDDMSTFTYRASPPTANTPLCHISSAHSLNESFLEVVSGDIVVKDG
jgi:hypothetical protein